MADIILKKRFKNILPTSKITVKCFRCPDFGDSSNLWLRCSLFPFFCVRASLPLLRETQFGN